MNKLDKQIQFLLKEATITIGAGETEQRYLMPDDIARNFVTSNQQNIRKEEDILANSSLDATTVEKFPRSLRSRIASIYYRHQDKIEEYRKNHVNDTPILGEHSLDEPWQYELLVLFEGDRAGAVGKGEILSCFLWRNAALLSANEKSVDVKIQEQNYSVKYAEQMNGEYKLNGVFDTFKETMKNKPELKKYTNLYAQLDSKLTVENIVNAIMRDAPDDKMLQAQIAKEYLDAADAAVKNISSSNYQYILFHSTGYRICKKQDVIYQSADSTEAKVGIKFLPPGSRSSGVLRKMALAASDTPVQAPAPKKPRSTSTKRSKAPVPDSSQVVSPDSVSEQKLLKKFVKLSLF